MRGTGHAITGTASALADASTAFSPVGPEMAALGEGVGTLASMLRNPELLKVQPGPARTVPPGPSTAVPVVSGRSTYNPPFSRDEYLQVMDYLRKNPYSQPIKGAKGIPSKDEQMKLAREFFLNGGKLPPAPWGRGDMQNDVKSLLAEALKGRAGPPIGD